MQVESPPSVTWARCVTSFDRQAAPRGPTASGPRPDRSSTLTARAVAEGPSSGPSSWRKGGLAVRSQAGSSSSAGQDSAVCCSRARLCREMQ